MKKLSAAGKRVDSQQSRSPNWSYINASFDYFIDFMLSLKEKSLY